MGIYLKINDPIIVGIVAEKRRTLGMRETVRDQMVISMYQHAEFVHYEDNRAVGILFRAAGAPVTHSYEERVIFRNGREYLLHIPNKRTKLGKEALAILTKLTPRQVLNNCLFGLIATRIKSKLEILELGFDYVANTYFRIIDATIYVAIPGVRVVMRGFDTESGVELIERADYRSAIKLSEMDEHNKLFFPKDPLPTSASNALAQLDITIAPSTLSLVLSDMYTKVCASPEDLGLYVRGYTEKELNFLYVFLIGLLHVRYNVEA